MRTDMYRFFWLYRSRLVASGLVLTKMAEVPLLENQTEPVGLMNRDWKRLVHVCANCEVCALRTTKPCANTA